MTQPTLAPEVVAAFWQRWGSNTFLSAQGLELELAGVGRAVVHLRKPTVMQRGGGGSADVINGGVIAYMFDAALGCAIASANLARPEMREVDRLTTERYGIPSIILMENAARGTAAGSVPAPLVSSLASNATSLWACKRPSALTRKIEFT